MREAIMILLSMAAGGFLVHVSWCHSMKMHREGKREGKEWRIK